MICLRKVRNFLKKKNLGTLNLAQVRTTCVSSYPNKFYILSIKTTDK